MDLPTPEWIDADRWADYRPDRDRFVAAVSSGNDTIIRYNRGHEIYVRQLAWWSNWAASHRSLKIRRLPASQIVEALEEEYHLDTATRYMHSLRVDKASFLNAELAWKLPDGTWSSPAPSLCSRMASSTTASRRWNASTVTTSSSGR